MIDKKIPKISLVGFLYDVLVPVTVTLTCTSGKGMLVEDVSVVNFIEGLVELALVVNCSIVLYIHQSKLKRCHQ